MLWTDLRILAVDTGRLWWRLLPQIAGIYLLGWIASHLILNIAVIAGDVSAWLTLVLFAFNFVFLLTATVLILRLAERELGIRDLIPQEEVASEVTDTSITRLLSVTLLPFLGMYAAFGQVAQAGRDLMTEQVIRYGLLSDQETVLGVLNTAATEHLLWLVALIVGIYVLRRVIDFVFERSGRTIWALLAILVESFFLLLLIMGGVRVLQIFQLWLQDRVVAQWWAELGHAIAGFFARFAIDLPAVVHRVAAFLADQVWPVFWEVLTQPIIWLAVAALVFGSRVLSLAELWRKGQPVARLVPGVGRFASYREKVDLRRVGPPPKGVRLAGQQLREAFLGDIDDKYLPTFHSIRLVLRGGAVFLGSYVLAYSVLVMGHNYYDALAHQITGGRYREFWVTWASTVELIGDLPFDTLRYCLLAVAFRRCLELFRQRTELPAPAPAEEHRVAPVPAGEVAA